MGTRVLTGVRDRWQPRGGGCGKNQQLFTRLRVTRGCHLLSGRWLLNSIPLNAEAPGWHADFSVSYGITTVGFPSSISLYPIGYFHLPRQRQSYRSVKGKLMIRIAEEDFAERALCEFECKQWCSGGGWEGGRGAGAVSESVAGAKESILTPETGECQSPPRASGLTPDLPKLSLVNLLMPLAGLSPGARLPDNNSVPLLIRAVARDPPPDKAS
ncbi:hypothetical protein CEXT_653241 [Caerostris extrusa]|uniref:Uncharacterized protein n=1 Tax=Caerostris extrusa TaxID=172846 RepID=A0AAV4WC07_CAEEX|nr:hypothetical protein CEXT_653241 [Caerostris extrusa]